MNECKDNGRSPDHLVYDSGDIVQAVRSAVEAIAADCAFERKCSRLLSFSASADLRLAASARARFTTSAGLRLAASASLRLAASAGLNVTAPARAAASGCDRVRSPLPGSPARRAHHPP